MSCTSPGRMDRTALQHSRPRTLRLRLPVTNRKGRWDAHCGPPQRAAKRRAERGSQRNSGGRATPARQPHVPSSPRPLLVTCAVEFAVPQRRKMPAEHALKGGGSARSTWGRAPARRGGWKAAAEATTAERTAPLVSMSAWCDRLTGLWVKMTTFFGQCQSVIQKFGNLHLSDRFEKVEISCHY
jgi:hypothetical protein